MVQPIPLVTQTAYADLVQNTADAAFEFPENGSFVRVTAGGREYWYHSVADRGSTGKKRTYVGPVDDPDISRRVANFKAEKRAWRERWDIVKSLQAAGLPRPTPAVGAVVAALARAGVFRLRGVLVGSLAFQAYSGLLGIKLASAMLMTGDIDIAQFHSVSISVDDEMPPILDVLREVDATYRDIPHSADGRASAAFTNDTGLRLEFLTPNRSKDEFGDKPAPMPALGGAAAQPLRFLDFLIRSPVDATLLHQGGVFVRVPAPERYAVHKLIVASRRQSDPNGRTKARKDVLQAGALIEGMSMHGPAYELGFAWLEAWGRGKAWQTGLRRGVSSLTEAQRNKLADALVAVAVQDGRDWKEMGVDGDVLPERPRAI